MTENPEHYANNLLGWRAIKGELKLAAFDRLMMDDVTDDVRLKNVFLNLGCKSLNEFLCIVAERSPLNYGKKSETTLAECLNKFIVNQNLSSSLQGVSIDGTIGLELQVIYGEWDAVTIMRFIDPPLWSKWRDNCLLSPHKTKEIAQLLSDALIKSPNGVPKITLVDALNRWSTLDALHGENNDTLLSVIRAAAWCANQPKLSKIENYLIENRAILSEAISLLESSSKHQQEIDTHSWSVMWGIVKLRGKLNCCMGELVSKANVSWPSNLLKDPISIYHEKSLQQLLQRENIGKVKALALARCLAYLAIFGYEPSSEALPPWEIVKLLKLKTTYTNVLNIRYAGRIVPTLDACGKRIGITRERVRQIEAKCRKLSKIMHYSESATAWLNINIENIWSQLSADGGVTVDSKDESDLALEKKLNGEYRLGLLLADKSIIQLLEASGSRTENGWSSKTKGVGNIVIKLSGKVKVVDI
jgi:hypothetical protein